MTTDPGALPATVDPCDVPHAVHKPLPLAEARDRIIADIQPVRGEETVGLRDALGRVLAGEVRSTVDVPSHRNSAMDGFAVSASELPASGVAALEIVGTSWAGRPFTGNVGPGTVRPDHDRRHVTGRDRHGRDAGARRVWRMAAR